MSFMREMQMQPVYQGPTGKGRVGSKFILWNYLEMNQLISL